MSSLRKLSALSPMSSIYFCCFKKWFKRVIDDPSVGMEAVVEALELVCLASGLLMWRYHRPLHHGVVHCVEVEVT